MTRYASKTTVPADKSRADIERVLTRYGASSFMYGWDAKGAMIAFVVETGPDQRRQVRFHLPLPDPDEYRFTHHSRGPRSPTERERLYEQATRQKWRALHLVVKAKLEAVESGIATFEDEFLAYIALPSGETVGEWISPQIEVAYDQGQMPTALPLRQLGKG